MQKIEIIGNLTAKPETREIKTGNSVCAFTVAVSTGKDTDFFRVNAWDKLGASCQKYLDKGRKVYVSGTLKARTYEAKGKTMISLDITASYVEFLSPAKEKDDFTDINPNDLPF